MTHKQWHYRNRDLKPDVIEKMKTDNKIPRIMAIVLLNRGIKTEDIPAFMTKSMQNIRNPRLLPDMDKATERILTAISKKEKMVVYGDYDVDGITATSMLYDFLKSLGADVTYYIPDRIDDGYGINIRAVNTFIKQKVRLIITVDCGITALGEVSFAKLQGTDVIITDHHTCKERIPEDAVAVIDPKRPDSEYPFDGLAGVGVAFKLVLAIAMALKKNTKEIFGRYIDLVTIGTIADVVSLTDENRIIVDRGVKVLNAPTRPGIKALIKASGLSGKEITSENVAFAMSPRINAAGRLGNASVGVELLTADNDTEAERIAAELDEANSKRRETELLIYNEAEKQLRSDPEYMKKKVIVLSGKEWHQGVIGIVASRFCEKYYRPCLLMSIDENGTAKGSGRSVPSFNLFDALSSCADVLTDFGGHAGAAGFNLKASDIPAFAEKINKYADKKMSDTDLMPVLDVDCPILVHDITLSTAEMFKKLEPFGAGNEKPMFSVTGVLVNSLSAVGKDMNHLRMRVEKDNTYVDCIGFFMGNLAREYKHNDTVDLAFLMEINKFNDKETVQLVLRDIKRSQ